MKNRSLVTKIVFLLLALSICYGVELTASFFTRSSMDGWYLTLEKPSWNPPEIVFPIVWTILYGMMAISLWILLLSSVRDKKWAFIAFFIQLFLNFSWSFSFFYLESTLVGMVNVVMLSIAIVWNIKEFYPISKVSAYLLFPYFFWVLYATSLNFFIWWYS